MDTFERELQRDYIDLSEFIDLFHVTSSLSKIKTKEPPNIYPIQAQEGVDSYLFTTLQLNRVFRLENSVF